MRKLCDNCAKKCIGLKQPGNKVKSVFIGYCGHIINQLVAMPKERHTSYQASSLFSK